MKIEKGDILTPANVTTIIGLALSIHGATQLDTAQGVAEVAVGRILDLLDGPIARATHTSRFGAVLDAGADKLAVFTILAAAWHYEVAPNALIGLVAGHNLLNVAVSLYAERQHRDLESSTAGKRSMFLENIAIAGFALAQVIVNETIQLAIVASSLAAGVAGLVVGAVATAGYIRHALNKD